MMFSNASSLEGMGGYEDGRDLGVSPRGSPQGETTTPGGDKRRLVRSEFGAMPLTIRMVLGAPRAGNSIKVNENDVGQVKILGKVLSIQQFNVITTWTIADSSGSIQCRFYNPSSDTSLPYIQDVIDSTGESTYVSVFGNIKFENKQESRYISVQQIQPISSFDEECFHIIQVANMFISSNASVKLEADIKMEAVNGSTEMNSKQRMSMAPLDYSYVPTNIVDRVERMVGAILSRTAGEHSGVTQPSIITRLAKEGIGASDVEEALKSLCDNGEAYEMEGIYNTSWAQAN